MKRLLYRDRAGNKLYREGSKIAAYNARGKLVTMRDAGTMLRRALHSKGNAKIWSLLPHKQKR